MKALVIGTSFMDCKGRVRGSYDPIGRNVGSVELVRGGVGRNVAVNMAHLGVEVSFVSSVDKSAFGNDILTALSAEGINREGVAVVRSGGMGIWVAVTDRNGELVSSVSQMPDTKYMEESFDEKGEALVRDADFVVLEIDLGLSLVNKVKKCAARYGKRVYSLPANLETVAEDRTVLNGLECFICNDIEAGVLFDTDLRSLTPDEVMDTVRSRAHETGAGILIVTMAERGSVYCDTRSGEYGRCEAVKTQVRDTTGAGDSFCAGVISGVTAGLSLKEALEVGSYVSSCTVACPGPVCDELPDDLRERFA